MLPHTGRSLRVGITGVPGVGKSTFIEALGRSGRYLGQEAGRAGRGPQQPARRRQHPGRQNRMPWLAAHPQASSAPRRPAAAWAVWPAPPARPCCCAKRPATTSFCGNRGRGPVRNHRARHGRFLLLLMLAGAGDELQGIKRGIMEMADALLHHQSRPGQRAGRPPRPRRVPNALHLFPPAPSGQAPPVLLTSAVSGTGVAEVWQMHRGLRCGHPAKRLFSAAAAGSTAAVAAPQHCAGAGKPGFMPMPPCAPACPPCSRPWPPASSRRLRRLDSGYCACRAGCNIRRNEPRKYPPQPLSRYGASLRSTLAACGCIYCFPCPSTTDFPFAVPPVGPAWPVSFTSFSPSAQGSRPDAVRRWQHLDLQADGVPGISADRAYRELLEPQAHARAGGRPSTRASTPRTRT